MIQRASIFFILFCASYLPVLAQYVSPGGTFQLDNIRGCAPLDVTVTLTNPLACSGATACVIDYTFDGTFSTGQPFTPNHTYLTPGTYTIALVIGASSVDQITVEVFPDTPPAFDIYLCAGASNTINVKITDTVYDSYTIDYSDGFSIQVPSGSGATDTHSFATAGLKTVSVRGKRNNADDNCSPNVQSVTVTPVLSNGFISRLIALPGSTDIQLDFTNPQFTIYKLEIATNSTTFQPFKDIYNLSTITLNNLRTDDNYYCFRLGTFDPCTQNILAYSDVICSADLDVSAQNGFNSLQWRTKETGIDSYTISKQDPTQALPSLTASPPTTTLTDADVICTIEYAYQMTSNYSNGSTSISLEKKVTAFSTTPPTAVQNISTVVDATSVNIEWDQDPAFTPVDYALFKAASGLTNLIARTTTTNYTDENYNTLLSTCYKISYEDICGNESGYDVEACPMQLTAVVGKNNAIDLAWNAYTGWINGVNEYAVQKFDTQGQLLQTFTTTSPFLTDDINDPENQVYTYVVTAIPNDGGINNSVSNSITVIKNPNLFYPTAFTPNGDDLNDFFNVSGQFIQDFELKVFSRWGELIFTTNDPAQGWNGRFQGDLMPEGTYAFIARITDFAGRTFDRSGAVLLLKKN